MTKNTKMLAIGGAVGAALVLAYGYFKSKTETKTAKTETPAVPAAEAK